MGTRGSSLGAALRGKGGSFWAPEVHYHDGTFYLYWTVPGKVIGPGHNGLVTSPDGKQDYIVYHAWNPAMTRRQLWVDPLTWTARVPQVDRFVARVQECNRAAEERHAAGGH